MLILQFFRQYIDIIYNFLATFCALFTNFSFFALFLILFTCLFICIRRHSPIQYIVEQARRMTIGSRFGTVTPQNTPYRILKHYSSSIIAHYMTQLRQMPLPRQASQILFRRNQLYYKHKLQFVGVDGIFDKHGKRL